MKNLLKITVMIMICFFIGHSAFADFKPDSLKSDESSADIIIEVSGPQSGVWIYDNTYEVIGDISVLNGDTLIIEPGVLIEFMDDYSFNIFGTLIASGNEYNRIYFVSGQLYPNPGDWNEIKFEDSSNDNSIISYSCIKLAKNGIYCSSSSPTISNNYINDNYYSGIYCTESSSPTITNNNILYNNDFGICSNSSTPTISNNRIRYSEYGIYCTDSSTLTISNNVIGSNNDGICCFSSSPLINDNTLINNYRGIYCDNSFPTINNNIIKNNDGGIYCFNSIPSINKNNIINNNDYGISCNDYSSPFIVNNIFYENYTGILAYSPPSSIEYNIFWGNVTTATGDSLPTDFGEITIVNANEDSCDIYYNLFMNPLFIAPGTDNFLLTASSPCIDAGNPDPVYNDPDETIADMGAFYFDQSQPLIEVIGPQSGIWTAENLYHVIGDISVPNGDTLIIEPGVIVKFMDDFSFTINGSIFAIGTETDSIYFTSGQVPITTGWTFIQFEDSSNDNSNISYACIEHAIVGISCHNSSPFIRNNTIRSNAQGVYCGGNSSPLICDNTICNNGYAGIRCMCYSSYFPTPLINNNIISNSVHGIEFFKSSPIISNNIINNSCNGIYSREADESFPAIYNNTFSYNGDGIRFICNSSNSFCIFNNIFSLLST